MKYYGTAAYSCPDWGMGGYYAREDRRQAWDDWEAENRRLHESELIEIAKKSAREFIHNADGEPYAQEDWEMYLTEDASRVNKDTEAAMNYAIDDGDWFTLTENIGRLVNS
ncbi:hypothetical protein [Neisseria meningitidis]|uniref:hypothetical protein n=1 Tax=Neisseria meningitidis TaxID=487 RepID=UPI0021F168CC|nr:hypothetical protein [Neisseria meningitidis]MCV6652795.1 hypothetical protein [Neisseria meningitidis]MCV6673304.1 hypothetical protein [Neisseria meningitidis]MCV6749012.1 hypothetical protein [Neisseria meningitidis]